MPILAPMSEIAGRLATQIGTTLLQRHNGGRGLMLGGLPSAERGHVVVLGAGNVGLSAASVAAALGARVTVLSPGRERQMRAHSLGANVTALPAYAGLVERYVVDADLLIGAVLIPGARAPRLVDARTVGRMNAGSVIVDVSVDQGGCVETIRPTTYEDPTYTIDGVVHFGCDKHAGRCAEDRFASPFQRSPAICIEARGRSGPPRSGSRQCREYGQWRNLASRCQRCADTEEPAAVPGVKTKDAFSVPGGR